MANVNSSSNSPTYQTTPRAAIDPQAVLTHKRWLTPAKIAASIHVLLSLCLFGIGSVAFFDILTTPCQDDCAYFLQLRTDEVQTLYALGWTLEWYALFQIAQEVLYLFTFTSVAAIIYAKLVRKRDAQTWFGLLTSFALVSVGTILLPETSMSVKRMGPALWLHYDLLKASGYVAFMSFCLLFPNGIFAPRWARWIVLAILAWMALWIVGRIPNLDPSEPIGIYLSQLFLALMVGTQIYRYCRVSSQIQRQQTKWFVFGFVIVFVAVILWGMLFVFLDLPSGPPRLAANLIGQGILATMPVFFAVCIGTSLIRYQLWDIDVIINRTLVYSALTVLMIALYASIVSVLGLLFQRQDSLIVSLLATGFIAVIFQPVRTWLQSAVNRWLFGERDDPARVLTRLTDELEQAESSQSLLTTLVEIIAASLKLPHVALWLDEGEVPLVLAAQTSPPPLRVEHLPLIHQQETIGDLVVAPRSPGEAFSVNDRELLASIARLTATTVRTIQLTGEVQEARIRTVSAREEERRRLRRDLHDGLGPALASQGLKLAAARQLLRQDPGTAERLLDDVMARSESTVADVRRLVYALRPPTLDELGLVEAIREQTEAVSLGTGLQVSVDAPKTLPTIPAAVEVAAFRITQEAVNNVVRHAQAEHCKITISVERDLSIHIQDDGVGLAPETRSGIGLLSMRERATEVGGSCVIEADARTGGVVVRILLPTVNSSLSSMKADAL